MLLNIQACVGHDINFLIPNMTSYNHEIGTASASKYFGTNYPWKAFNLEDVSAASKWEIAYTQPATTNDWLKFEFNNPVKVISNWLLIMGKGVGGTVDVSIRAILADGSEVEIGVVNGNSGQEPHLYFGTCDVRNVKGVRIVPTAFTTYSQVRVEYLNVLGQQ